MNKIYTSVLCMALLVPTVARAEICTDFDDNMNIIEFDCAEGVKAARKRIAAEQEKVRAAAEKAAEQERVAAEKAAAVKRQAEEQRLTTERAAREKAQLTAEEKERVVKEQLKRAAREKLAAEQELAHAVETQRFAQAPWRFFVGVGAGTFGGDTRREDAFLPDELRQYYSIDYYASGDPHFVLSAGVRRHFVDTNWFAQLDLEYRTAHSQRLETEINGDPAYWGTSVNISDDIDISRQSIDLSASIGYRLSANWSMYGKLGVGLTKYKTEKWNLCELESDSVHSANFGLGAEYKWNNRFSLYGEGVAWVGSFPYSDTLLSGTLGVRFMF